MTNKSDTPRTDAEAEHCDNVSLWCNTGKHGYSADKNAMVVPVEFARTLERELAECQKQPKRRIQKPQSDAGPSSIRE